MIDCTCVSHYIKRREKLCQLHDGMSEIEPGPSAQLQITSLAFIPLKSSFTRIKQLTDGATSDAHYAASNLLFQPLYTFGLQRIVRE